MSLEWNDLEKQLSEYIFKHQKITYIFSPFISTEYAKTLLSFKQRFPPYQDVVIVTNWRKDHLLSGVSNIDLFLLCKKKGYFLYINDRLHAKIYSDNFESGWLGSANLTRKGLNDSANSNIEVLYYCEKLDDNAKTQMLSVINDSILVNDDIYNQYKDFVGILPEKEDVELPEIDIEETDANKAKIKFELTQKKLRKL